MGGGIIKTSTEVKMDKKIALKERRSGALSFLFSILTLGIYNIVQAFQLAKEINITCADDGKETKNPLTAFLISLLLDLVGFGWLYWLIYKYKMIKRLEEKSRRNGEKPKLTATSWILSVFFGVFTLYIWTIVNYFKRYALWNQINKAYNSSNQ